MQDESPWGIRVSLLPDGRVLLQLVGRLPGAVLATARCTVEDGALTAAVLRGWAESAIGSTLRLLSPGIDAAAARTEFRGGYSLLIEGYASAEMLRFAPDLPSIGHRFGRIFRGAGPIQSDDVERFAADLPRAIRAFHRGARRKAAVRLADGAYASILRGYLERLRAYQEPEDQRVDRELQWDVGGIVDDERYLLLSDDAEVRELLHAIGAERAELYSWYMDLAKLGERRPRRPPASR
jgi:hypothetical protein